MPVRRAPTPKVPAGPREDTAGPAIRLLTRLLREAELAEVRGAAARSLAWQDHELSPAEVEPSARLLEAAEQARAVQLDRHDGYRAGLVRRVRIVDADALASFLGVQRYGARARRLHEAIAPALSGAVDWLSGLAEHCSARWARGEAPFGLSPDDPEAARETFQLLAALAQGGAGRDRRRLSVEATGRTKALEERRRHVVALLRRAFSIDDGVGADDVLRSFGVSAFLPPVLLRASFALPGVPEIAGAPYVGLPEELISTMRPTRRAPYLLLIENLASFNRHVREQRDEGFVLYTGGFPSAAVLRAAAVLASHVDGVWHWGDIDPGGVRIFALLEEALPGLKPHLMDPELAMTRGREADGEPALAVLGASSSAIAPVAQFLTADRTWTLEQESLDPQRPA